MHFLSTTKQQLNSTFTLHTYWHGNHICPWNSSVLFIIKFHFQEHHINVINIYQISPSDDIAPSDESHNRLSFGGYKILESNRSSIVCIQEDRGGILWRSVQQRGIPDPLGEIF